MIKYFNQQEPVNNKGETNGKKNTKNKFRTTKKNT